MILERRISSLKKLGEYMKSSEPGWMTVKERAAAENGWFIPEFIDRSIDNIASNFLAEKELREWLLAYPGLPAPGHEKNIGIVMAGNIPLVGFHDLLAVFASGHRGIVKLSSKDQVLPKHLAEKLMQFEDSRDSIQFADLLKGADAYIATGSSNTSRYFEYYFAKYPHIIRRNKTSVAVLHGHENDQDLGLLADDVYTYFGLGCRNVTKIFVPNLYNFEPLLQAFRKYSYLSDHHKYKNNYDYNLALHLLNGKYYMTNGSILLIEESPVFSPISQLNYEFFESRDRLVSSLQEHPDIQCVLGRDSIGFGRSQMPGLFDYADGVDTMAFLQSL